jgi:hypothetical protein
VNFGLVIREDAPSTADGTRQFLSSEYSPTGRVADVFHRPRLVLTLDYHAADFDRDGDVDLTDYGYFLSCFNGPGKPPARGVCGPADLDEDGDVDLADYGAFLACYNGPARPPGC